ncbi:MAG: alcohol dehydrogenase catalytic domain-containing protein [Micrococcales bacterium]|nr:alcohol dehydrogenase catalytic domain-containing protein [Micrococcales bacterium]
MSSAICGSELHGFRSSGFRVPPLIMGHEFAGMTPDGRRVVINPLLSCGHCDACLRNEPQLCRTRALIGVNRDGGFAERVSVPNSAMHTIPDSLAWSTASLTEPLANAVHANGLLGKHVERVGIIGAGPIGLVCALVAAHHGHDVMISDTSTERQDIARSLGLKSSHELDGEFDAIIDAVGLPVSRQASVAGIRAGGTAVWIGLAVDSVELSANSIVREEKHITGSFAYTAEEFGVAIELATQLDLSWTTDVPLSASAEAFLALAGGERSMVKAIIVPDSGVQA